MAKRAHKRAIAPLKVRWNACSVTRYGILGDLVVETSGGIVSVTRQKQRAVLGALLLQAGGSVSIDRVADAVWGETLPPSARELIRVYVSQLRETLGDDAIETRTGGYAVPNDTVTDSATFRAHLERARAARTSGDVRTALAEYDGGLALWRGLVLADCSLEGEARTECRLLEDLRRDALEERFAAALEVTPARELVAELEAAVAAEPTREGLTGLLMLALYRAGRQADALEAYREARSHLASAFGIDPGPELRELERRILNHDSTLAAPAFAQEVRRPRKRGLLLVSVAAAAVAIALVALGWPTGGAVSARPESVAELDADSGRVLADVRLSAPVTALTTGNGLVLAGTLSRTIAEIDGRRAKLVRTVGVATPPPALAFAADGIWASNGFSGRLTRVGLDGFESPSFRPEPSSTGRLALAADGQFVWVGAQDDSLTRLTADQRSVASGHAAHPQALTVGFGSLWVAQATSVEVMRADRRSGKRQSRVPLGAPCVSLATGAASIWALSGSSPTLWRIDPTSNSVTAAIPVETGASEVVAAANNVWVVASSSGTLQAVDVERNRAEQTVELGHPIGDVVIAGRRLWLGMR